MIRRSTTVVTDALAYRRVTYEAATEDRHGLRVTSLSGLAARLAGPFVQVADDVAVRRALRPVPREQLEGLAGVAELPGFARAAATTLRGVWDADLDLAGLAAERGGRWAEVAALERKVHDSLPPGVRTPDEVVGAARARAHLAPRITGDVMLEGLGEVPKVYRPLLEDLARHVRVQWRGRGQEPAGPVPEGVEYVAPEAHEPTLSRCACADPHHEVVEALRWARSLLASGRAAPGEIAIASASAETYEDGLLALADEANLPVHAAHGVPALNTRDGQVAAALADVLLRGLDQDRVHRFVSLARRAGAGAPELADLPPDWTRVLPREAPLSTPERWERGLADEGDGQDAVRAVLRDLGADLARGAEAAAEIGERWLAGGPKRLWRRALDEGPPAAIDVSLGRLRADDGEDPAASVVWTTASSLAASPRPFVRLLGLASRSWPRRSADDPLLPRHVLEDVVLHERSLTVRDREDFHAVLAGSAREVGLSRALRDAEGRKLAPSPLLRQVAAHLEEAKPARRAPRHAFSEADRRLVRPNELADDAFAREALATWRAWSEPTFTAHDGRVRADHPALVRALERVHSTTSLKLLLRNPLGFVWQYALGWSEPGVLEEGLVLDPLARGSLVHDVLEKTVLDLEAGSGLADASEAEIAAAADRAAQEVGDAWSIDRPVPPDLLWRTALDEARAMTTAALRIQLAPLDGQRSFAEVPFGGRPRDELRGDDELPWDPDGGVPLTGTGLRIAGRIDRLDLARDGKRARVVDYKTSAKPRKPEERAVDVNEGKELQRCLYAFAVRELLGAGCEVEAMLVYPATGDRHAMRDADATLTGLAEVVNVACERLRGGYAVPGDDAFTSYFDLRLALPAHADNVYAPRKEAAFALALEPIQAILTAPPPQDAAEEAAS